MTLELRQTSNLRRGFDWIAHSAHYWIASFKILMQKLFTTHDTGKKWSQTYIEKLRKAGLLWLLGLIGIKWADGNSMWKSGNLDFNFNGSLHMKAIHKHHLFLYVFCLHLFEFSVFLFSDSDLQGFALQSADGEWPAVPRSCRTRNPYQVTLGVGLCRSSEVDR